MTSENWLESYRYSFSCFMFHNIDLQGNHQHPQVQQGMHVYRYSTLLQKFTNSRATQTEQQETPPILKLHPVHRIRPQLCIMYKMPNGRYCR